MDTNITIDADASTALATISTSLPTILAADQNDILGKLAAKVAAFVPDISTAKGRRAIASLAAEVATSKMDLVRLANGMMEADRKRINAILAERKIIEDRMDALKAHVRADLTAYEEHQKAVERANEDVLAAIEALAVGLDSMPSADIKQRSHQLAVIAEFDWSPEFTIRAGRVQNGVIAQLEVAYTKALQREADAIAEVARQAEEAERARLAAIEAQRVREERIAEEARLEAEAKAAVALERAEREKAAAEETARHVAARAEASRMQAHQDALAILCKLAAPLAPPDPVQVIDGKTAQLDDVYHGRDREEFADEAASEYSLCAAALIEARTASLQAEADHALERDRIAADRAEITRKAEAAQAAREQAAAVEAATLAEQRRAAAVEAMERAEAQKRAANRSHQAKINGEVLADLLKALDGVRVMVAGCADGPMEGIAKAIITAIAKGSIRHVRVEY